MKKPLKPEKPDYFDAEEWERFLSFFSVHHAEVRDLVRSPARSANDIYFVAEGLVRFFYVDDEGSESDRLFAPKGQWARPVTAVALGLPYGCQALEPSTLIIAPYAALSEAFRASLVFERFDGSVSRTMLSLKDRHLWSLQNLSAADRVADFATRFPDLVSRVPQYHIASYLGMSSVSYSRLKKKVAS